jgi:hypothetical protein
MAFLVDSLAAVVQSSNLIESMGIVRSKTDADLQKPPSGEIPQAGLEFLSQVFLATFEADPSPGRLPRPPSPLGPWGEGWSFHLFPSPLGPLGRGWRSRGRGRAG